MKKLKLDLDDLKVESFIADRDGADERGTVRGRSGTHENTWVESCHDGLGCEDSIMVCGSSRCPLTEPPSGSLC